MNLRGLDDWLTREPDSLDPGRSRDEQPDERVTCDWCDVPILSGAISLQGVGVFCGRYCATLGSERHALQMQRRIS